MASDILKSNLNAVLGKTPETVSGVVSGSLAGARGSSAVADQFNQLTQQLQQLQTASQAEAQTLAENTQAVNQNTSQLGQAGTSTASHVTSTLQSTLGLFTGLSPLITGLASLFGGGGSSQPGPPTPFLLPPSVSVNAGMSEAAPTQAFSADYAAGGQPRLDATSTSAAPQITVQVQALDSQSILDRSQDIAAAVRQAMLESSVLNDVIQGAMNG
ncbi:MAG: hypothetical protein JO307_10125 [Bryobacterales bacterium]|nr:hypothetical protein [Bryobacterales bacterium]MBV9397577.1 hypothetical protein [Bryobacterales bacterium]